MGLDSRVCFSYLLRLWLADENEEIVWRCLLQDVRTGKVRGFATLDDLDCYLREKFRSQSNTSEEVMPGDRTV